MIRRARKAFWRRSLPAILAGAWIGGMAAASACAQSWLSEPPVSSAAAGPASLIGSALTVPQLLELVGKADAKDLYPVLRDRAESELAAAPQERAGRPPWERKALLALIRLGETAGTPAEQERAARAFVDRFPDDDQFPIAFVQLNQALARQDKPLETSFFFDQAAQDSLPPVWVSRYLLLRAVAAERNGDFAAAADFRLREFDSRRGLHQSQPQEILDTLERVEDQQAMERLLSSWSQISWVRDQAPFLKIRAQIHAGRLGDALLALERIERQAGGLSQAQHKLLLDARNEVRRRANIRPERIGVLLPLGSAALGELARDTLDGLRIALGSGSGRESVRPAEAAIDYEQEAGRESRKRAPATAEGPLYELVIRDTGNNPALAAQAVEALAQTEGVIAIIGPLARAESEAAAARADELGVPLISLSLSLDLPPGSQFVFRNSKSQEEEVRDLVQYAMDYLQARRFAILYPASAYGERMLQLFWDEARRKGATLAAASAFTPWNVNVQQGDKEPVGLKQVFESFVGQDRPLRPADRALLEAVGDPRPDPVVDFDALFIPLGPDAGQDLRLIAPYPVTVDAENVLLLGTRFWNDDAVLVAGGNKLEGSVFADVYDRFGGQPRVAAFQNRHHSWYGHRPRYAAPSYYTAAGFDTLSMVIDRLRDPSNRSREALARSLKTSAPYSGMTGLTAFRTSGEANKETIFFRIRGNEFLRQSP